MATRLNVNYLLSKLRYNKHSQDYHYQDQIYDPRYGHHFPYFNQQTIKTMTRDSRIKYGLGLLKGPVMTYTKFFSQEESESPDIHTAIVELNYHFPYAVVCENKDTEEFIIKQLNRFWEVGVNKALTAIEWGFSASEVMYKKNSKGQLIFDNLYKQEPIGINCLTRNKGIIGFTRTSAVDDRYIPLGKAFWHVHQREVNPYYGESALKGAHIPWHETWSMGGARDIRRTWFFKNAYDGGQLYFPEGEFIDEAGNSVSFENYALQMLEMHRSGSGIVFPSTKTGMDNKRDWEYIPPKSNPTPTGLEQYVQALRDEMLEGLGIPPEVVQSAGNDGMGSATGRMVPLMAFIASLTPITTNLIGDFCHQILPILLRVNKMEDDYEIYRIVPKTADNTPPTPVQEQTVQDTGLVV